MAAQKFGLSRLMHASSKQHMEQYSLDQLFCFCLFLLILLPCLALVINLFIFSIFPFMASGLCHQLYLSTALFPNACGMHYTSAFRTLACLVTSHGIHTIHMRWEVRPAYTVSFFYQDSLLDAYMWNKVFMCIVWTFLRPSRVWCFVMDAISSFNFALSLNLTVHASCKDMLIA